jgi:hypothetical protein
MPALTHNQQYYYKAALRKKLVRLCPNYGTETIESVVNASIKGLEQCVDETVKTLLQAIDLAVEEKEETNIGEKP